MKATIKGHETYLTPEIKKYAEKKTNKLIKYNKEIIAIELTLEEDHNKKERTAAVAKALIQVPGSDISATASAKTIFAAIDELERKLSRQLDKGKNKRESKKTRLFRQGKDILRKIFKQDKVV
jgi:ribosomal subunit interface protein